MSSTLRAKRYALLLETIVGLALTTLLLTTLLGIYRRVHMLDEDLGPIWAECTLHNHLGHILPQITAVLSVENEELICTFDNGIDRDPHFCSEVVAKLYRDSSNRFVAAIWPSPKFWKLDPIPCRQILLASEVEQIVWTQHGGMIEVHLDERALLFPIYRWAGS